MAELAVEQGLDPDEVLPESVPVLRHLVEEGFLVPATLGRAGGPGSTSV